MKKYVEFECDIKDIKTYGPELLRNMRRQKIKAGRIVYAIGAYGNEPHNPTILINTFNVPDSPWVYNMLCEFLQAQAGTETGEVGRVYIFDGTFAKTRFEGFITEAEIISKP